MVKNRLVVLMLTLIMTFTMVISSSQDAIASGGTNIVIMNGFGAGTGFAGRPGTGQWNTNMQGVRITVINHYGVPAFEFNGRDHLDILFSTNRLGDVTHFIDGVITSPRIMASPSPAGLNSYIMTVEELDAMFLRTYIDYKTDRNQEDSIMSFKEYLPKPLENSGGWRAQGDQIFQFFKGEGLDSQLVNIINMHTVIEGTDQVIYSWQPKELLTLDSRGYRNTMYFNPLTKRFEAGTCKASSDLRHHKRAGLEVYQRLNKTRVPGAVGSSETMGVNSTYISDDELFYRYRMNPKRRDNTEAITPAMLIKDSGFGVIVEPIIWNRLRKDVGTSDDWTNISVYGTQANIARFIDTAHKSGSLPRSRFGWDYGGGDTILFGRGGRKSMILSGNLYMGRYLVESGGKLFFGSGLNAEFVSPPSSRAQVQTGHSTNVSNSEMIMNSGTGSASMFGWGMHGFYGGVLFPPVGGDITVTLVLVDDDGHVITERWDDFRINANSLTVKNVVDYTAEVALSFDRDARDNEDFFDNIDENTTWDEIVNGMEAREVYMNPDTIQLLFGLTRHDVFIKYKKTGRVDTPGELEITESQITRAVETIDDTITNWGRKTMNFAYTDLNGRCEHVRYCSGCRGNWEDGYYCNGHRCGLTYQIRDGNHTFKFRNTLEINDRIQANVGNFRAINYPTSGVSHSRGLNAGLYGVDEFNYQLVLWRGRDIPTIASYKESSSNSLNSLIGRYGNTPAGTRARIGYTDRLNILLDRDESGDYRTMSGHHGFERVSNAVNGNTLSYNGEVIVRTYSGRAHEIGNETVDNAMSLFANLAGRSVNTNHSGGKAIAANRAIKFYPYVRMTYQLPAQSKDSKTDVYVLSQWVSELHPHSYVESAWGSTTNENMNISSVQWSTHQRAVNGEDGWQGNNKVLPGGAIFNLDTRNQNTYASVITWQPYLEDNIANNVIIEGASHYRISDTVPHHTNLVTSARNAFDNWRVVQYVETNTKASNAFGGVKVEGGGQSLRGLGLSGSTSKDAKYYLKPSGQGELASQGDLDIVREDYTEIHYKVSANTSGDLMVHRKNNSTDWVLIDTIAKDQDASNLSPESLALDARTKIITNLLKVLTRNEGDDVTASWATSDGKWYNEAFDGICYVRRETSFELGFVNSPIRSSALDPSLMPASKGQGDLFSTAFISQFRLNDKSDAYRSEVPGFVGTFKGQDVVLPGAENMFRTRVFSIPNVSVQDLR